MSVTISGDTGLAGAATGALNGSLGATTPSSVVATNITASGATDYGSGIINTSGGGLYRASQFGLTSGAHNVLFSGSTDFIINDSTNNNNIVTISNSAPNGTLKIDASGNVGVGVTPSAAWVSTSKVLQINGFNSLAGYTSNVTRLSTNAVFDATNEKYGATGTAAYYQQGLGVHSWYTAPSGTAGNAITFTQAMTLDASGNLLVGKTSAISSQLGFFALANGEVMATMSSSANSASTYEVYSTGASVYRFYVGMGGTVFATATTITAISDQRLKENIRDLDYGLSEILALQPRRFDWKEGKGLDKKDDVGFIAQEFELVLPSSVGTSKAGGDGIEYKNVNHGELIPTLVKAIQEQQALITSLTARLEVLEAK